MSRPPTASLDSARDAALSEVERAAPGTPRPPRAGRPRVRHFVATWMVATTWWPLRRLTRVLFPALLIALLGPSRQADACSVCFGASDALVSKSLDAGVLVLVGFVVLTLTSIAYTAVVWSRRAKALRSASQD